MNNHSILVVEDEPALMKALVKKLSDAGYSVDCATNGQEGLEKALATHPDLLILDIILPRLDGVSLLKKIREDEWGKGAKAIFLTNLTDENKLEEALAQGTSDYLIKSDWNLKDVIKKVQAKLAE